MPKSVMGVMKPSEVMKRKVLKEKKRKNLGVLRVSKNAATNVFFPAKILSSNGKAVALTRAPENVGENNDISFEAPFTLSLAD